MSKIFGGCQNCFHRDPDISIDISGKFKLVRISIILQYLMKVFRQLGSECHCCLQLSCLVNDFYSMHPYLFELQQRPNKINENRIILKSFNRGSVEDLRFFERLSMNSIFS